MAPSAIDNDRAVIDRLWNRVRRRLVRRRQGRSQARAAAPGCRTRRDLAQRIEPVAGVKMLLGVDPKKDYKDKVANVDLR